MTLNTNYMIAPNLQEYFVDKTTGTPLAGGNVFYYSDTERSTLKTVYTLVAGVEPGTYVYTPLPNPVPLSGVGTTTDGEGNDIRVYYYPYNDDGNVENYYIVVKDADGVTQLTRQAWPNIENEPPESNRVSYNFVRNPTFYSWSNTTEFKDVKTGSATQYDFMPDDWIYSQDDSSQTINISRGTFASGENPTGTNAPYYSIYECTSAGSLAGTYNAFSQYYKSVQTLNGQDVVVSIWMKKVSGTGETSISLTQHFGTGGSPHADLDWTVLTIPQLTSEWKQYTGTIQLPSISGMQIGTANNDALILNVNMPLNQTSLIHIGPIRLERGDSIEGTQLESNDDILKNTDVIGLYSTFRTGDFKSTLRNAADPGWVVCNDGTIGKPGSGSTLASFSTKALYALIWSNINVAYTPIYTSAGVLTTKGASAQADFDALKRLSLTKTLGRVLATAGQATLVSDFEADETTDEITISDASSFSTGVPVTVATTDTLPSPLLPATTYYCIYIDATTIKLASSLDDAANATPINLTTNGLGTNTITIDYSNWAPGQYVGDEMRALGLNDMPNHLHNPLSPTINFVGGQVGGPIGPNGTNQNIVGTTGAVTGYTGQTPFWILQPTVFLYTHIKL